MSTQKLTTSDGKVLPASYQKWNLVAGFNPPHPLALRYFIIGLPGKGKTSYVASMSDTVHIDPEDTTEFCQDPKATPFRPKNGRELQEFIDFLVTEGKAGRHVFKHVVFDTAEKILQFIIPELSRVYGEKYGTTIEDIREWGQGGAGWGKVNTWFQDTLNDLHMAGYGWTCVGHLREDTKTVRIKNETVVKNTYRSALNPGIQAVLYRDSQFIMMVQKDIENFQTDQTIKLPGGKSTTRKVDNTRNVWKLELSVPESGREPDTVILKQRLAEHMPDSVDITGYNGFQNFCNVYQKAIEQAKKGTE
jgi:hypothetical protein